MERVFDLDSSALNNAEGAMLTAYLPIGTRNEESKKMEALSSPAKNLPVTAFLIYEAQALVCTL